MRHEFNKKNWWNDWRAKFTKTSILPNVVWWKINKESLLDTLRNIFNLSKQFLIYVSNIEKHQISWWKLKITRRIWSHQTLDCFCWTTRNIWRWINSYSGLSKTKSYFWMNWWTFDGGACAMYAFEKEIPKISQTKLDGWRILRNDKHEQLNISNSHRADIRHAASWRNILENLQRYDNLLKLQTIYFCTKLVARWLLRRILLIS